MNTFKYPADKVMAFWAAVYRSDVDAMRRFFNEEPDLFRKVRERNYAIVCEAAKKSSPEAVRVLLELGEDVDEQDANGWTGLCWAISYGRYEVAKALLENGANPQLHTALFHVVDTDVKDPVAMAKLLLDHGADINQPFLVEGLPPRNVLSEAMARGRQSLIEFLKSRGAKLPDMLPAGKKAKRPRVKPLPAIIAPTS